MKINITDEIVLEIPDGATVHITNNGKNIKVENIQEVVERIKIVEIPGEGTVLYPTHNYPITPTYFTVQNLCNDTLVL
jgi:hypothetical protein